MRPFDQLDWVHRFDDYEMLMYVLADDTESDGIYMQVMQKIDEVGAESWDILYDRRLSSIIGDVEVDRDHESFEDEVLRKYLREHPSLVEEEKMHLKDWIKNGGGEA